MIWILDFEPKTLPGEKQAPGLWETGPRLGIGLQFIWSRFCWCHMLTFQLFFRCILNYFHLSLKKNIIYQVPWQESFMAQQTGYSLAYLILTCSLKHWPSIWQTIFYSCYFLVGKSQFQWVITLIRFNMDIENKIRKISHLTSKVLYLYKAMFCFEGTFMLKNCWKLKFISWKKIINRWKV